MRSSGRVPFDTVRRAKSRTDNPRTDNPRTDNPRTDNPRTDGFRRETFTLPREDAREKARDVFSRFPKAAYMTEIEFWRELPDGLIEFTMRRLPSAD